MELFTPGHLLVIAIVAAVLFFGWKQLPDMTRSLGKSLRIFKTEMKGLSDDNEARDHAAGAAPPASALPPAAPVVPAPVSTTPTDDEIARAQAVLAAAASARADALHAEATRVAATDGATAVSPGSGPVTS